MTPDFDPNKNLEENLKKDGEFLRDVDKGHTPTETGLDLDLGVVRDEHIEVMDELGTVADAAAPEPPVPDPEEPSSPEPTSPPATPVKAAQPTRPPPAPKGRFGTEAVQTEHARTFVELGKVILDAQPQQEQPTPLTSSVPEMERLSFPREQHQTQVRSGLESVIAEQAQWNATVTDLFGEIAEMLRQHRLELDQIRGFLERIRL